MPLTSYGVLRAKAVNRVREGSQDDTPHYQLHLVDDQGVHYRAAINVKSQEWPSELLFRVIDGFDHPILPELAGADPGWTSLPPTPAAFNLDFIRGNLFAPSSMRTIPPDVEGPDNDLADLLDLHVLRAIADAAAEVYVFGEPWSEPDKPDKVFGFPLGRGVHDVHMNQGNSPEFYDDDGVWQDGGLLLHFPGDDRWVALFLAFQSQAWHTDDVEGHSLGVVLEGEGPRPGATGGRARIVAALVNSRGTPPEVETVSLLNTRPDPLDLTGWSVADRLKNKMPIESASVAAGECVRLPVRAPVALGNSGGLITLLDRDGLKIDGVAYTWRDAKAEGWTISFGAWAPAS